MKKTYSTNYLGTIPASDEHIRSLIRRALKGTGFSLCQRGRNPNRRQFYDLYPNKGYCGYPSAGAGEIHYDLPRVYSQRGGIQQDLPLEHATSIALYLRSISPAPQNYADKIVDVKRKIAKALEGQPMVDAKGAVTHLLHVKDVNNLPAVVTCIGQACKVLSQMY